MLAYHSDYYGDKTPMELQLLIAEVRNLKRFCAVPTSRDRQWAHFDEARKTFFDAFKAQERVCYMVKKQSVFKKPEWKGFATINCTAEQLGNFLSWEPSWDEVADIAEDLIREGYKVSMSMDQRSSTVTCALTCNVPGDANAGLTMVATGPGWFKALCFVLWKHREVANGDWTTVNGEYVGAYS